MCIWYKHKATGVSFEGRVEYVIAEGFPAVNGEDAEIKMYELSTLKPKVVDSDKVNHYELNS